MSAHVHYQRNGEPYPNDDGRAWARDFEDDTNRVIALTELDNGITVSTVWLGLNHQYDPGGPPLIFETMAFPTERCDDFVRRYSTEDQAVAGHADSIEQFRGR